MAEEMPLLSDIEEDGDEDEDVEVKKLNGKPDFSQESWKMRAPTLLQGLRRGLPDSRTPTQALASVGTPVGPLWLNVGSTESVPTLFFSLPNIAPLPLLCPFSHLLSLPPLQHRLPGPSKAWTWEEGS